MNAALPAGAVPLSSPESSVRDVPARPRKVIRGARPGGEDAGTRYSDPNDFYDAIIKAEGTGKHGSAYETSLGYTKSPKPLTQMTMDEVMQWGAHIRKETAIGRKTNSSAKGAFQIVNSTQRDAMRALGIRGNEMFSEENQRRMASWIARRQGLGAWEGLKINPGQMARARQALQAGAIMTCITRHRPPRQRIIRSAFASRSRRSIATLRTRSKR